MWGDSGGVVLEGAYGEVTWQKRTTDSGGRNLGGWGTSYLCVFLPPGADNGEMPVDRLPGSSS